MYIIAFGYKKNRDVTIIDINRLSVAKAFRFSIINSQISLSIVFDIDNMWKLCVISLISKQTSIRDLFPLKYPLNLYKK